MTKLQGIWRLGVFERNNLVLSAGYYSGGGGSPWGKIFGGRRPFV